MASTPLGDFLRGRRARVSPRDAGVPVVGARRVPGLRREEVAMLAGMSVDYYVRLEQGRERHSSAQVLDALSQVLHRDRAQHRVRRPVGTPRRASQPSAPPGPPPSGGLR
jgi:hypothetical protein